MLLETVYEGIYRMRGIHCISVANHDPAEVCNHAEFSSARGAHHLSSLLRHSPSSRQVLVEIRVDGSPFGQHLSSPRRALASLDGMAYQHGPV